MRPFGVQRIRELTDNRATILTGRATPCVWINEYGRRPTRISQVAGNHCQDRVGESLILGVALDNHRRADLLPRLS
jgi:hypothetical protein